MVTFNCIKLNDFSMKYEIKRIKTPVILLSIGFILAAVFFFFEAQLSRLSGGVAQVIDSTKVPCTAGPQPGCVSPMMYAIKADFGPTPTVPFQPILSYIANLAGRPKSIQRV